MWVPECVCTRMCIVNSDTEGKKYGLLLETCKVRNIQYYSIATGKMGEKNEKKYYEVYPELYTSKEARIVISALQMIKWADTPVSENKRIYSDN